MGEGVNCENHLGRNCPNCAGPVKGVPSPASQKVLEVIQKLLIDQDDKGLDKYGRPLEPDRDDYPHDWNLMAMEEMADGLKYLVMENARLRRCFKLATENSDSLMQKAIKLDQELILLRDIVEKQKLQLGLHPGTPRGLGYTVIKDLS